MNRIQFKKNEQKEFMDKCIENLNLTSIRGLLQLGLTTTYNNLKNYYTQRRTLPEYLFQDLTYLAKINPTKLDVQIIGPNWGQIKGGKKSKRVKSK